MDFYKPKFVHGLDLNLNFFFVTLLRVAWLSDTEFILLKKLSKERSTCLSLLIIEFQSTGK